MISACLLIAVFAARFFVTAVAYPQLDGDISWQRWLGFEILRSGSVPHALGAETFTAAGAPWLPHEWLFSIAAALGSGGGGRAGFFRGGGMMGRCGGRASW